MLKRSVTNLKYISYHFKKKKPAQTSYYTTVHETSVTDNIHGHPYEDYYHEFDAT